MKKLLISLSLLSLLAFNPKNNYQPTRHGELINHKYYSLSYIEKHEQAEWVYFIVQKGTVKRYNNFREDKFVTTKSATLSDYKNSGYDRGHLCPAAAMKINKQAMSETFYMSNMSPQKPYFNKGVWKNLETYVRNLGYEEETHVITGPVFKDNLGTIGTNKVTIPGYYYQIVYQPYSNYIQAFLLPNKQTNKNFWEFKTSIDNIEKLTDLDFFPQLPDSIEDKLEK